MTRVLLSVVALLLDIKLWSLVGGNKLVCSFNPILALFASFPFESLVVNCGSRNWLNFKLRAPGYLFLGFRLPTWVFLLIQ